MSILKKIIEDKIKEVENDKKLISLSKLKENLIKKNNYFQKKLEEFKKNNKTAIVAEVKKASPSKGILLNNFDHIKIAEEYVRANAACLSVLTENKHTLNISTASALVLASMGLKVAKHGNKSLTSKCGSADVLEKLGISINQNPEEVKKSIEQKNFGFMFAPNYHAAMKNVANARKKIKTRTIFNLLGPLANPALVKRQCIGVFSNEILDKYSDVLKNLHIIKAWVFHSEDGLDEISIFSKTNVIEINGQDKKNFSINPRELVSKTYQFEEIVGNDAEHNAKKIIELFNGKENAFLEIVSLNCAAALVVAEKELSLKDAFDYSRKYILSGIVIKKINELKQ